MIYATQSYRRLGYLYTFYEIHCIKKIKNYMVKPGVLNNTLLDLYFEIFWLFCKLFLDSSRFWPAYTLFNFSLVHFCVLVGLFWKVLNQNPGQLKEADTDSQFSSIGDLIEAGKSPDRFCIYCEVNYDHHCLFLNQCVGRDNHRIFILFIISMVMSHLIFILSAVYYLSLKLSGLQMSDWGSLAGREASVLLLTLLNIFSLIWVGWLLVEQLDAISMGTTTYFRRYDNKGPSKRQRLGTILTFLLEHLFCNINLSIRIVKPLILHSQPCF
uniref:Palmitoyltransferase n=1 Tax=Cyprinus carpio TaxID=7962 RepID=A0A8C1UUY4_CYPCA